jgi:hypothetical protein
MRSQSAWTAGGRPAAGSRRFYLNFIYAPLREHGDVSGIFVHAVDVTGQVPSRARSEAVAA